MHHGATALYRRRPKPNAVVLGRILIRRARERRKSTRNDTMINYDDTRAIVAVVLHIQIKRKMI